MVKHFDSISIHKIPTFRGGKKTEKMNSTVTTGYIILLACITHPEEQAHSIGVGRNMHLQEHGGRPSVKGESSAPTGCQPCLIEILWVQATVDNFSPPTNT